MDGRRLRRWFLCGGLLVPAVGCNRTNTYQDMPKPGLPALPAGGGMMSKSPVWGGGQAPTPTSPQAPAPGVVAEGPKVKPRKPGTGLSPDAEVALADTHIAAAFTTPPPGNRDELIDMARMRYQKALKEDPKNKNGLLGVARMYARLGDRDKAMETYKKYLDLYPKDGEVLHEVAIVHGQWRDWTGAVTWCEAALKLDPENRKYRKSLGFCQARAGKWEDGFATLCRVMPEAQARFNLAGLLDHLNYTDASRQQLQLALQADPGYAPAREFLAELDQAAQPGGPTVPGNPDPNPVQRAGYMQQP